MARPGRFLPSPAKLIDAQPWNLVSALLAANGVDAAPAVASIRRYSEMLIEWNRSISNLISRNDEERIVERHILESLEPIKLLRESGARRWIDFGSGAGLPAIPLALAGIGDHWTLVESRRPKTLFIRKVIQELSLKRISVEHGRLESLIEEHRLPAFDGFTSRATIHLGPTLVLAAEVVSPGGVAFLWKGSRRDDEMASDERWRSGWTLGPVHDRGEGRQSILMFNRNNESR